MSHNKCPMCDTNLLPVFGRPHSPFLIVGIEPSPAELTSRAAWTGDTADVLKDEMQLAGMSFQYCRATYLWLHAIPPARNKEMAEIKKMCFDYCFGLLVEQMSTAKVVFALGADVVRILLGKQVSKVSGIPMQSKYTSAVVFPGYSPGLAKSENGTIGEVRFAIREFVNYTKPILKETMSAR